MAAAMDHGSRTDEEAISHPAEKSAADHNERSNSAYDDAEEDIEAPIARGVDVEAIPHQYWLSWRFLGAAFSIILLAVSLYVNFTLPASVLLVINEDLGPSPVYIFITTAGSIVVGPGILLVGRISDIVGRRWFLIGGQFIGIVASVIMAKATSINMLIGGSALQGFATTAQLTFPYAIQELVPNQYRGYAQAAMLLACIPFAGFGSVVARSLLGSTSLGWRWAFYMNTIFCSTSFLLMLICYHPPTLNQLHSKLTWRKELKQLDYGGIFLYTASLALILLALAWGGGAYAWDSSHVLGTLVTGCVLLIAFVLYETFVPLKQPLLPLKILKNRNYVAIVIVASVGQMAFFGLAVIWPEQIAYLYPHDNVTIGWMSCTSNLALAVGEIIIGPLLKPIGHTRWQLIFSTAGLAAFLGALAACTQHTQSMALAFTSLAGFFTGWLEIVCLVANGLVNKPGDLGLANGFLGSVRQTAGVIAVSVYVAVLTNRITHELPKSVAAAAAGSGLPATAVPAAIEAVANGTANALAKVPGINPTIIAALEDGLKTAYSASFKTVYLVTIAFSGIALIAAVFTSDIDHLLTGYVSRRVVGTVADDIPDELTIKHT